MYLNRSPEIRIANVIELLVESKRFIGIFFNKNLLFVTISNESIKFAILTIFYAR